jgi:hypothetical protein
MTVLVLAFLTGAAQAEPRFAVRKGVSCSTCHVNPTGGGMRNVYGRSVFETAELPAHIDMQTIDPTINGKLALGGDFRLAYLNQFIRQDVPEPDTAPPEAGLFVGLPTPAAFFPMQVDIYAGATLSDNVVLYTDFGAQGSFEAFGLVHDLPGGTYIKAGFFTPPYGIKLPNHSAATRQPIGFDPTGKDAGIEIGITQSWLDAQVAIQNGEFGGSPIDSVRGKSISGRAAWLYSGPITLTLGGSGYTNTLIEDVENANGRLREAVSTETRFGPLAGASLGDFTWLGELGMRLSVDGAEPTRGEPTRSGQLVSYQELVWLPTRGFEIAATYEYMDRDTISRTDPSDGIHRPGLWMAWFPLPFTEINVIHRVYIAREDREENGQHELIAFIHLFY